MMRTYCIALVALTYSSFAVSLNTPSPATQYVTYKLSGGRFGDNLASYLNAKWVAYTYNLTLLYYPFPYSDQLVMHTAEQPLSQDLWHLPVLWMNNIPPTEGFRENIIHLVPYFTGCVKTDDFNTIPILCSPDWTDKKFAASVRAMISPRYPEQINMVVPPPDKISIALHVRTASGGDRLTTDNGYHGPETSYSDVGLPGNHPREEYYVTCLRAIIALFSEDTQFYVYLFTDHENPSALTEHYAQLLSNSRVTFDCGTGSQRSEKNVLDDFFSMTRFSCLILPASNFSFVASKLADFQLVIEPAHITGTRGNQYVDLVKWTVQQTKTYILPLAHEPNLSPHSI